MNKVQKILDMIDVVFFTSLMVLFYFNMYLIEWSIVEKPYIDFARNLVLFTIVIWGTNNKKENQSSSKYIYP